MITVVNVDKNGILGTRVYASVADLPANPNIGQLACVDTGTETTYYRSVEGYPYPVWELWNAAGPVGPAGPAGPAGPTGAQGLPGDSNLDPPDFPLPGQPAVSWDMVLLPGGVFLPWLLSTGYKVLITPRVGKWYLIETGILYVVDAHGTTAESYGPYPLGQVMMQQSIVDTSGLVTSQETLADGLSELTVDNDRSVVAIQSNFGAYQVGGYLLATITVTPPPWSWSHTFDFTTGEHGWILRTDFPVGTYVSGQGWEAQNTGGDANAVHIEYPIGSWPSDASIVRMTANCKGAASSVGDRGFFIDADFSDVPGSLAYNGTWSMGEDIVGIPVARFGCYNGTGSGWGEQPNWITAVTIYGAGTEPSW